MFSHKWLIAIDQQGEWPSWPAGQWAEGLADVPQGAGVLPQMAPGGRDNSQRSGRRLPEGRPVAGLCPCEGAEATTGGRAAEILCVLCVCVMCVWDLCTGASLLSQCHPWLTHPLPVKLRQKCVCVWVGASMCLLLVLVCSWEGIQRACECLYALSAAHWSSCPALLRNSESVCVCVCLCPLSPTCHLPRTSLRDLLTHTILCFM